MQTTIILKPLNFLSKESIPTIKELISAGMNFDKNSDGTLAYTKEAAHSRNKFYMLVEMQQVENSHILLEHCP